jgi:hypothetical protein
MSAKNESGVRQVTQCKAIYTLLQSKKTTNLPLRKAWGKGGKTATAWGQGGIAPV